jgi:hypothetical protein
VLKKRADKKENYGKYVKEMYWPKASDKLKVELETLKERLHHRSPVLEILKNRTSNSLDGKSGVE